MRRSKLLKRTRKPSAFDPLGALDRTLKRPIDEAFPALAQLLPRIIQAELAPDVNSAVVLRVCQFFAAAPVHDVRFGAHLCLMLGAMIEAGADATAAGALFIPYVADCVPMLEEASNGSASRKTKQRFAEALENFALSTVAFVSAAPALLSLVHSDAKFMRSCVKLRWDFGFLHKTTHLLVNEEILVLHWKDNWGFRIAISGIGDLVQLRTLMLHYFKPLVNGSWPDIKPSVLKVMLGTGPVKLEKTVPGVFDMYGWSANVWAGDFSSINTLHFLFGEGVPADIMQCPLLDNKRVVLLGPESYARFTNCARAFESLKATFTIIEQLSTETVKEHLETLKAVTPEEREAEAKRISDVTWMQNPNFEGDAEEDDEDDGEEVEVEEDNEADE